MCLFPSNLPSCLLSPDCLPLVNRRFEQQVGAAHYCLFTGYRYVKSLCGNRYSLKSLASGKKINIQASRMVHKLSFLAETVWGLIWKRHSSPCFEFINARLSKLHFLRWVISLFSRFKRTSSLFLGEKGIKTMNAVWWQKLSKSVWLLCICSHSYT